MFLLDTNIFLEILLSQEKKDICKKFLQENKKYSYISDFSLHSIGIILFRYGQKENFIMFLDDVIPRIKVVTLPLEKRNRIIEISNMYRLDYDDSYQVALSSEFGLQIVTMDKDFEKVKGFVKVLFL